MSNNSSDDAFYGGALVFNDLHINMSSIAQLISEIAHSYGQPNNYSLREKIRSVIVHTRAEIIRRSYENHNYVDKLLTQRFKVTLTSVVDGDFELPEELQDIPIDKIKRTNQKVPRPIRLTNNLPFDRVSTAGYRNNRELPYIKETTARFRGSVPGLCGTIAYDYINEYIYLFPPANDKPINIGAIIIESSFEQPNQIADINGELTFENKIYDDNEWLLSEDMVGQIKDIIFKRDLLNQRHETDEIPSTIKYD